MKIKMNELRALIKETILEGEARAKARLNMPEEIKLPRWVKNILPRFPAGSTWQGSAYLSASAYDLYDSPEGTPIATLTAGSVLTVLPGEPVILPPRREDYRATAWIPVDLDGTQGYVEARVFSQSGKWKPVGAEGPRQIKRKIKPLDYIH